jgi:protocatechuate 3,4-dioxygenase, beta subunit
MDEQKSISRRSVLRGVFAAGGLSGLLASSSVFAAFCRPTPAQTAGPFYPEKNQPDKDWDLTQLNGASGKALGEVIQIRGQVIDQNCKKVPNAMVEIWQACASGRYNHSGDTSGLPLDPNFQYWGRATSDAQGNYLLQTILPGHYPASPTWERPPHIHFRVMALGFRDLTTQMYFQGRSFPDKAVLIDELNRKDAILQSVPKAERESVIIEFVDVEGVKTGKFDISVTKV